jgi:hypothetical protein
MPMKSSIAKLREGYIRLAEKLVEEGVLIRLVWAVESSTGHVRLFKAGNVPDGFVKVQNQV